MPQALSIQFSNWSLSLLTLNGAIALAVSLFVTSLLIPRILSISYKRRLFDSRDSRKIHDGAIPRLGGIAFMPAVIVALSALAGLDLLFFPAVSQQIIDLSGNHDLASLCFGVCALMLMYLLGIVDDLFGLHYGVKLVVQIVAALLLVGAGLSVNTLYGCCGIEELPLWVSRILSVLIIVLIINSINLIDGIDGLAAGLASIACAYYVVISWHSGSFTEAMIGLATIGTLIPFFLYNVFGNARYGKKIFMGDTGALTIGLIIGFLALQTLNPSRAVDFHGASPLVVAFSPLVVPCLDVIRVVFHRLARGHNPFHPGLTHIHHKFLALGWRQRYAMLAIFCIAVMFIVLNLLLSPTLSDTLILIIDCIIWFAGNGLLTAIIHRRQNRLPDSPNLYE